MARNIEIKARLAGAEQLRAVSMRAEGLAAAAAETLLQDDTFFTCSHGRLKLREFADGSAELIHYTRADGTGARLSDYVRCPVADPAALREALTRAQGQLGRVRKRRLLVLIGATRVHLDEVEGVGSCLELEVVLRDGQTEADGVAIAEALMQSLGVADAPRIAGAYLDLLRAG